MPARGHILIGSCLALVVLLAFASPVEAIEFDNDVRARFGLYIPDDLPTDEGAIYGLELRNLLTEADGIYYGIYRYDEQKTETAELGTREFTFESEIEIVPLVVGWFHLWRLAPVNLSFGIGGGLYDVEAFSGGYNLPAGVQVSDFEEFRQIDDGTRFGFQFWGCADFFPGSRVGVMVEARFNAVEDDLSAAEISTGVLFRF